MPQLPSGRRVGLCADPVLELARKGSFELSWWWATGESERDNIPRQERLPRCWWLVLGNREVNEIAPLISVVYFTPKEGVPEPGEPALSGLMLADVGSEKCDWSKEDLEAFRAWEGSEAQQSWRQQVFEELRVTLRKVPPPLPDNLKGILD